MFCWLTEPGRSLSLFQGAILKYLPSIINDIQTVFDPVELR